MGKSKSKVLGILSICIGLILPFVGVVLAIIGLSISKEKRKEGRDIALNVIGLVLSVVIWIVEIIIVSILSR